MKVLDEKGKLFGKINLIDLIVIVVAVGIVAAVGWKVFGSKITEVASSKLPTIEFEVLCLEIDPDSAAFMRSEVDAQIMNNGDMMDAYITDCTVEPNYVTTIDADGNAIQVENPEFRNVRATIKGHVRDAGNAYAIGNQELRVGKTHIVKTVKLEVAGTIISVKELPPEEGTANG